MLLFSIYVILVLKNTCFKAVPLPLYAFGAVGAIAVELFLCNLWVTRIGLGVGRYHYRRVITLLLFVFFILIIANYVIGSRCNQLAKRAVAIIDYGAVLIYAIFQFPYLLDIWVASWWAGAYFIYSISEILRWRYPELCWYAYIQQWFRWHIDESTQSV